MWKLVATGAGLLVLGAVKFAAYLNRTPTLEDYLAFRCGPSEQALLTGSAGHALAQRCTLLGLLRHGDGRRSAAGGRSAGHGATTYPRLAAILTGTAPGLAPRAYGGQ